MSPFAWTFDPAELGPLAAVAFLYAVRWRTLARRGRTPSPWRAAAFATGLLVSGLAVASPIDTVGEQRLLSVHMVQHLMLGDVGPLLIVLGVTGPLLRPVLALPYVGRLRVVAHPVVALAIWTVLFCGWHLPSLYQAALHHDTVHACEHTCFFIAGTVIWAALLEPLPGPAWFTAGWKIGYLTIIRLVQATVANILIFDDTPLYPYYSHVPRLWHLSASSDQNIAGSLMFLEGMIVLLCAYGWALARFFTESEVRQILLERGAGESAATRAARYGRGVAHAHSTPATAYKMVEGPAVPGSDPQTAPGAPQTAPGSLGRTAPR